MSSWGNAGDGFLNTFGDAEERRQSSYFPPTFRGRVEIIGFKEGANRGGRAFFAIETKVVESHDEETQVGQELTQLLMKDKDQTAANLKAFLRRLLKVKGNTTPQEWVNIFQKAIAQPSPLVGYTVDVSCKEITTKAGNPFTIVDWGTDSQPPSAPPASGGWNDPIPF